ncbi:gp32 [Listeria phage P40]|uniref:DNA primase n=1 Tax=Listeria phage P40 TaxID=560178 RepID=UPI00018198E6|nr:DNA primase [Listeria phage P40]ACI00392.1 gp32 [Listeria phage P40]
MFREYAEGQKFPKPGDKNEYMSCETLSDAGYLLESSDIVVDIDFSDCDQKTAYARIDAIIRTFDIKTQVVYSNRGAHFYFEKPNKAKIKNGIIPIGLDVEFKTKSNSPNGITIKQNGKIRTIKNEGKRDVLPVLFQPAKYSPATGRSEGDGRNNYLFKHLAQIKAKVKVDDIPKVATFINEFLFDEALGDKELNKIIDQALDSETLGSGNLQKNMAQQIVSDYRIVRFRGSLWYYEDNRFKMDDSLKKESSQILRFCYILAGDAPTHESDEIFRHVERLVEVIPTEKVFHIRFKNGILDPARGEASGIGSFIEGGDLLEFTPYYIDVNYYPDAEPVAMVDDYITNLTEGDEDYRKLLLECLGSTLITNPETKRALAKLFIFIGKGGEGKGTMLTILRRILGDESVSASSIEDLTREQYLYSLTGKLANLCDDVENKPINDKKMKILKNISTCDRIELRKMREQSFPATLTCSLILTSNHLLKSFEKGESWKRRVVWLPMFNRGFKKDPRFITKVTTPKALEYWVRLMMEGYNRIIENGQLTSSEKINKYNEEYERENNNVIEYCDSITIDDIVGLKPKAVYDKYTTWYEQEIGEKDKALSAKIVKETVSSVFDVEVKPQRIHGTTVKAYSIREDK